MFHKTLLSLLPGLLCLLSGCISFGEIQVGIETPVPRTSIPDEAPTQTQTIPDLSPTQSPTDPPNATPTDVIQVPQLAEDLVNFVDAIQILQPGPGSRVVTPFVHIEGVADPTFDQTIVVSIVLEDGTELNRAITNINAEAGQRGTFSVDMEFSVTGEQIGFIQVFSTNPRDGFISHLSSFVVTFADSGVADIRPNGIQYERILITGPAPWGEISGGIAHIEGFALPSFENHLFIELIDEDNNVLGSAPVTVDAPDIGMPGSFSVDIPYSITQTRAGRIVIHDPSALNGSDVHLTTVEVVISP